MATFKKFIRKRIIQERACINCQVEEEAKNLLEWARKKGMIWQDGIPISERGTEWRYGEKTCYVFRNNGEVSISSIEEMLDRKFSILKYDYIIK